MDRQVPPPSACAWAFDLESQEGPTIVVLRTSLSDARNVLEAHVLELGAVKPDLARRLAQELPAAQTSVIW